VNKAYADLSTFVADATNGRLALFGCLLPGSGSHPVVNESLGGGVLVSCVKSDTCVGHCVADSFSFVRRRCLRVEQRDRGTVRVTNQRQRRADSPKDGLDERALVPKVNDPVRRPVRALARIIRIRRKDAELRREKLHQFAPLPRAARVRMNAYDSGAGSCLAKEGFKLVDVCHPPNAD
jgi:hypothetical protein